ncbi:MAG: hypothetical protein LBQ09_00475 [Acidobacteriaceae bacterium]|jgi:translation initiation factor 1|nr:hypothetical protein [Acidobacteriaceae bacterium]
MSPRDARLVYSTSGGRTCPTCGWPADRCVCSRHTSAETVPSRVVAKLRIETSGRGGKTVTVVYDLPRNSAFLKALARELKHACGTGGSSTEETVEIQGDQRERIRPLLAAKGWTVKG